jgi:electron transfer flavoprotein beta subunit
MRVSGAFVEENSVKILVCIKRVPDTSARIKVGGDGKSADLSGVEHIVSPYDEYAMEDALVLKEAHGGEVVAVSIGDDASEDQLRTCLAVGADRAVLVRDDACSGSDSLGIARVLAAVVAKESPDVVYLGKQGTDGDFHAVGAQLATLAGLPFVSAVYPVSVSGSSMTCERPVEGGIEELEVTLPVVVSAEKARGKEPRYANLKGIMMAKKKPIERLTLSDLGVDASTVGDAGRKVSITSMAPPAERSSGTILKDLPTDEAVDKLLTLLREEAKVL